MITDSTPVAARSKLVRSAITNGNRPMLGADGRSAWVRRWKDLTELHVSDLGGPGHLSEGQLSLCRRGSTLEIILEQIEAPHHVGSSGSPRGRRHVQHRVRQSAGASWKPLELMRFTNASVMKLVLGTASLPHLPTYQSPLENFTRIAGTLLKNGSTYASGSSS